MAETSTTEYEQKSIPLRGEGVHLDAESIRAELDDAPESHDLTSGEAELIARLDDDQINQAVRASLDDHFWAAYDDARRTAIARLAHKLGMR